MCVFFREELTSERMQTAELQTKLRTTAQERLEAEEQRGRLERETQSLHKQLVWHQDLLSSTKETVSGSSKTKLHTATAKDEDWDQVHLQTSKSVLKMFLLFFPVLLNQNLCLVFVALSVETRADFSAE